MFKTEGGGASSREGKRTEGEQQSDQKLALPITNMAQRACGERWKVEVGPVRRVGRDSSMCGRAEGWR